MAIARSNRPRKDIKVTLVYPPHQSWPGSLVKPNGSLAYPMLGGALIEKGIEVAVFDATVGNASDALDQVFYRSTELPSGLYRTGVSDARILEEVADADIVGLTSIFSDQETMVLATARLIKQAYPEKLIVSGGVNARHRLEKFFANGIDVICLSEAERTIVAIADRAGRGERDFSSVSGVAFRRDGDIVVNRTRSEDVIYDLDELPMPAWHLLPNDRYWAIGRPHGGHYIDRLSNDDRRYASMMTSLGCPFACTFCHIAGEIEGSLAGEIGNFRIKSETRVLKELDVLDALGVRQVYIEDDSLFGRRNRAIDLLRKIRGRRFEILDVNGVNVVHLLRKGKPDRELLEVLVEAGFKEIALPFESASPRIIKKWVSNKWDPVNSDIAGLLALCREFGIITSGNYMIGYPDETREEIDRTVAMAKQHVEQGLVSAHFMCVMPLPGTPMFEDAIKGGHLPRNYDIDRMHWVKANLVNTPVPPAALETIRDAAWDQVNSEEFKRAKRSMVWGLDGKPTPVRPGADALAAKADG